jgi:hypothetical protein
MKVQVGEAGEGGREGGHCRQAEQL